MLKWWKVVLDNKPNLRWGRILDPACRRGDVLSYLFTKYKCGNLWGIDKNRDLIKTWKQDKTISKMNLDHFLPVDYLTYDYGDLKFDRILTTPPYKLTKAYIDKSLNLLNKYGFLVVIQKFGWLSDNKAVSWLPQQPLHSILMVPKNYNEGVELFIYVFKAGFKGQPTIEWLDVPMKKKRFTFILRKSIGGRYAQ